MIFDILVNRLIPIIPLSQIREKGIRIFENGIFFFDKTRTEGSVFCRLASFNEGYKFDPLWRRVETRGVRTYFKPGQIIDQMNYFRSCDATIINEDRSIAPPPCPRSKRDFSLFHDNRNNEVSFPYLPFLPFFYH